MPIKIPGLSKKAVLVLIVLTTIGAGYAFYFLGYVKSNEIKYQERAHRVLNQIGQNVIQKNESNKKVINSIQLNIESYIRNKKKKKTYNEITNKLVGTRTKLHNNTRKNDSLLASYIKEIDSLNRLLHTTFETQKYDKQNYVNDLKSHLAEASNSVFTIEFNDSITLQNNVYISQKEITYQTQALTNSSRVENEVKENIGSFYYTISNSIFFKPLIRKDIFEEFIVIENDSSKDFNIIYETFNNKITKSIKDSIIKLNNSQLSDTKRLVHVGQTDYKVFTHNIEFNNSNDSKLVLVGCVKYNNYSEDVRSISFWVIINTSLIVIFLLFLMPILKLSLMNSIERLHRFNVFLTGLAIVMGSIFITLLIIISVNYSTELNDTDRKLSKLTNNINNNFNREITKSLKQLQTYDSIFINDSLDIHKYINGVNSISNGKKHILRPQYFKNFDQIFWTNKNGEQKIQIFPQLSGEVAPLNLSDRNYIKAIKADTLWYNFDTKTHFYLESIVSRTTNKPTVVVSAKSKNKHFPYMAIATKLKSVIEPILPKGYEFAILTANGNVLLHSDKTKNLQENFLAECQNPSELRTAIYAKNPILSTVSYHRVKSRVSMIPIKGTPLYLAAYFDLSQIRSKVAEIWSVSLILIVGSFTMAGIILLVLSIVSRSNRKTFTKNFVLDWMAPKQSKTASYIQLLRFNLSVMVITFLFFKYMSVNQTDIVFILIIIPSILLSLNFWQLGSFRQKLHKHLFVYCIVTIILLVNISFLKFNDLDNFNFLILFIYQLCILISYLFFRFKIKKDQREYTKMNPGSFKKLYVSFLFSWLLASAVLPTIYIYTTTHQIESKLWAKHTLLELKKNIELQIKHNMNNNPKELINFENSKHCLNNNNLGIYTSFSNIYASNCFDIHKVLPTSEIEKEILQFRPKYNDEVTKNMGLIFDSSFDNSIVWASHKNGYSLFLDNKQKNGSHNLITFQTKKPNFFLFIKRNTKLSILLTLVVMSLITILFGLAYKVIWFSATKIYGLEFKPFNYDKALTTNTLLRNNSFLIGLPSSGKTTFLREVFKDKIRVVFLNCTTINHTDGKDKFPETDEILTNDIVVLDNFEYHNDDHKTNTKKMKLLELLLNHQKQIILTSEVEPTEILDMYSEAAYSKELNGKSEKQIANELEIWRHLLSSFTQIYKPLTFIEPSFNSEYDKLSALASTNQINKYQAKQLMLMQELEHGSFLHHQYPILKYRVDNLNQEEIVLLVQDYVKSYYYALWNALTKREKFAVFDMSKDGFINAKNVSVINTLLKKGLFVLKDNKIDLMNQSFKNFVLSVLTSEELEQMNTEVRKKGKWGNIRIILILIILSMLILIGFGRPDFFKNMNKILIALAGIMTVLPTITKVFSFTQKIK